MMNEYKEDKAQNRNSRSAPDLLDLEYSPSRFDSLRHAQSVRLIKKDHKLMWLVLVELEETRQIKVVFIKWDFIMPGPVRV